MGIFSSTPKSVADLLEAYPPLCAELVRRTADRIIGQERERAELARPKTAERLKGDFPNLVEEIEKATYRKGQAEAYQRLRYIFKGLSGMGLIEEPSAETLDLLLDGSKSVEAIILEFGKIDQRNKALQLDLMRAEAPQPVKQVPAGSAEPDGKKEEEVALDGALVKAMEARNERKGAHQGARPQHEVAYA